MGERLIITLTAGQTRLACKYSQYGAFTECALNELLKIRDILQKRADIEESLFEKAIYTLKGVNGEMSEDALSDPRCKNIPRDFYPNKYHGLIYTSNEAMDEIYTWKQGYINIDLASGKVVFDSYMHKAFYELEEYICDECALHIYPAYEDSDSFINTSLNNVDQFAEYLKKTVLHRGFYKCSETDDYITSIG